jgi:hypothetical protein
MFNGLGSKDNKTISCDSKENIKFAVNNTDLFIELTPEMYLEKEGEGNEGTVLIILFKSSTNFSQMHPDR